MKKNPILIFAFLIVTAFGFQTTTAQMTISIPKIPKIKKDKPVQSQQDTQTTTNDSQPNNGQSNNNQTNNGQSTPKQTTTPSSDKYADNVAVNFHISEIRKWQKMVDEYDPNEKIYLVPDSNDTYLLWSVSPRAREKWMKNMHVLDIRETPNNRLDAALDALGASAKQKLPTYLPAAKGFAFHNLAEEKMMKDELSNLATLKIFKIGLVEGSWLIDKNDLGIPTARYKHGRLWVRDTADDHPYCHVYYVNIVQDYAGGGTYGASSARFIQDEMFGCPAN